MESKHECFKCAYKNKCHPIIRYNSITCNTLRNGKSRKENKNETNTK